MSRSRLAPLVLVPLLLAVTAACSDAGAATTAVQPSAGPATVHVEHATVDVPPLPEQAAVRMEVVNGTAQDDELVEARSSVADHVSIHRSDTDAAGRATMTAVARLSVPARSTVTFEPGGLHVMLTGIHRPLEVGERIPLRLRFERAGWVQAQVAVQAPGSSSAGEEGGHDHG